MLCIASESWIDASVTYPMHLFIHLLAAADYWPRRKRRNRLADFLTFPKWRATTLAHLWLTAIDTRMSNRTNNGGQNIRKPSQGNHQRINNHRAVLFTQRLPVISRLCTESSNRSVVHQPSARRRWTSPPPPPAELNDNLIPFLCRYK